MGAEQAEGRSAPGPDRRQARIRPVRRRLQQGLRRALQGAHKDFSGYFAPAIKAVEGEQQQAFDHTCESSGRWFRRRCKQSFGCGRQCWRQRRPRHVQACAQARDQGAAFAPGPQAKHTVGGTKAQAHDAFGRAKTEIIGRGQGAQRVLAQQRIIQGQQSRGKQPRRRRGWRRRQGPLRIDAAQSTRISDTSLDSLS